MSQGDVARDYLDAMLGRRQVRELEATGNFRQEVIPFADHIFTLRSSQEHLMRAIAEWIGPAPGADPERPVQQEASTRAMGSARAQLECDVQTGEKRGLGPCH